jgi:hypothetical protein
MTTETAGTTNQENRSLPRRLRLGVRAVWAQLLGSLSYWLALTAAVGIYMLSNLDAVDEFSKILLIGTGSLSTLFTFLFITALLRGETVRITKHWGRFGGAYSGWQANVPAVYLLLLLILNLSFAVTVGQLETRDRDWADRQSTAATQIENAD